MSTKKHTAPDTFALLRQMTSAIDRIVDESAWPSFYWPSFRTRLGLEATGWSPGIDVFEKNNRLVTRVDLPGVKRRT
jgi:HSP20 family molecular chaperone IbpA